MNKNDFLSGTFSALLAAVVCIGMVGWNTVLAEEAQNTAAEEATAEQAPADEAAPVSGRRDYYGDRDRRSERSRAMAQARRDQLERWRSWRRWMNNPVAEDRRRWNQARQKVFRDRSDTRRRVLRQYRSIDDDGYSYGYEEWRVERPGPRSGPRY